MNKILKLLIFLFCLASPAYADTSTIDENVLKVSGSNVGIGSANPRSALDVNGDVYFSGDLTCGGNCGSGGGGTECSSSACNLNSATTLNSQGICLANGTNCPASTPGWTDGGTNVYVTTLGDNVGIGTNAPSGKLGIWGNGTTIGTNTSWRDSAGAIKVTILDNGNLGIGSSNPSQKLDIAGNGRIVSSSATTDGLTVIVNSATSGSGISVASTATAMTGALFSSIQSGSNANNTGQAGYFAVTGSSSPLTGIMVTNGGSASSTSFRVNDTSSDSDSTPFLIDATGNVAIGSAAPGAKLLVVGTGTGTTATLSTRDSSANLKFTVLDNGNVGIGTATPGQKLEIGGSGAKIRVYDDNGVGWNCGPAITTGVWTCS